MTQRYFDQNEALRARRSAAAAGRLHDGLFSTPDWEAELTMEDELGYRFLDLSSILNRVGVQFQVAIDPAFKGMGAVFKKLNSSLHYSGGAVDVNGVPLDGVRTFEMRGMTPHVLIVDEAH